MSLAENRLLGIQIDETGREVLLSLIDTKGSKFALRLHGVERLLVNEMRQQNVIEEMKHWARTTSTAELREAAFALLTGGVENECAPQLAVVACEAVEKVARGEIEMIAISAIFGAQILASFDTMEIDGQ